jgi:hypothetical protein
MHSYDFDDLSFKKAAELAALCDRLAQLEQEMSDVRQAIHRLTHSSIERPGSEIPDGNGPRATTLAEMLPAKGGRLTRSTHRPAIFHGRPRPLRPWRD